jgi:hypothetical protein
MCSSAMHSLVLRRSSKRTSASKAQAGVETDGVRGRGLGCDALEVSGATCSNNLQRVTATHGAKIAGRHAPVHPQNSEKSAAAISKVHILFEQNVDGCRRHESLHIP